MAPWASCFSLLLYFSQSMIDIKTNDDNFDVCIQSGLFLTLLGTWPMALELGISLSFAQNWEFLAKYSVLVELVCWLF